MEQELHYRIVRSNRKTICISIQRDGTILVRTPLFCSEKKTHSFVLTKEKWIRKHLKKAQENKASTLSMDESKREEFLCKAKAQLPEMVQRYSSIMGVQPSKISITGAKTRFGSCSGKNAICFSWRLMAYPQEAIEYVVVHELAHIRYHNHQKEFYEYISTILPDWKERNLLLK